MIEKNKRREFLKSSAVGTAGLAFGISGVYIDKKVSGMRVVTQEETVAQ